MVSLQFSTLWPEATLYLSFTIKEQYDRNSIDCNTYMHGKKKILKKIRNSKNPLYKTNKSSFYDLKCLFASSLV